MLIKNGLVFQENGTFLKQNLHVESGVILDAYPADAINASFSAAEDSRFSDRTIIDAEGLYVIPGLVDVHLHGADDADFCDASEESIKKIAKYEYEHGITTFCPASMTLPAERLEKIYKVIGQISNSNCSSFIVNNILISSQLRTRHLISPGPGMAHIAGIHMEGPFINPEKAGAQKQSDIQPPNIELFNHLNQLSGNQISIVTLAPEMPGANEFIYNLKNSFSSVVISLGHSNANYKTAMHALQSGANHITHLFNAMPSFLHRDPGIIGAAADMTGTYVEVICDGIHIHPSAIRSIFRMFGDQRIVLISDSMRATGLPDGIFEFGEQTVLKTGKKVVLEDGTLAGSATNLLDCVKAAVSFGIPLGSAVRAAAVNPAKSLGVYSMIGSIEPGKCANLLLLDQDLNLKQVL